MSSTAAGMLCQRPVQHYAGHGAATIRHPINENIKQCRAGKAAYRSKALRAAQQGRYLRGGIWRALFSFSAAVHATLSFFSRAAVFMQSRPAQIKTGYHLPRGMVS